MRESHNALRETFSPGPFTKERFVHCGQSSSLALARIEAVGLVSPGPGFEFIRLKTPLPIVHATLHGQGEVWVGDQWMPVVQGQVYLMPAGRTTGYRLGKSESWRACWLIGQEPSLIESDVPMIRSAPVHTLESAIQGLISEFNGECISDLMAIWIELVKSYALRIAGPSQFPERRLENVWEHVLANLSFNWQLKDLARIAFLSEESVRRICRQQTGRTPMEHVTHLRMKSAASLLHMYPYSIDRIATMVGFSNAFSFSVAFKRWCGLPPSQYRKGNSSDLRWDPD